MRTSLSKDFFLQVRLNYARNCLVPLHLEICIPSPAFMSFIYSFIPLARAECDDSLLFSGTSSIPVCYIPFPSTLFHQLVFLPPSLHLAINFLVCLSASFQIHIHYFFGSSFFFFLILCTCPNQHNLFSLIASVIVGFLTIR